MATVLLDDPRDEARDIDETWVGTWEEAFGEARPISPASRVIDSLFSESEMRGSIGQLCETSLSCGHRCNGTSAGHRASMLAVSGRAQLRSNRRRFLRSRCSAASGRRRPRSTRDPHHDGLAHFRPGLFEAADWRAWLELQQSPRINSLLQFVNSSPDPANYFPISVPMFSSARCATLTRKCLIDDLEILQTFLCASSRRKRREAVATGLESISLLPARARFAGVSPRNKSRLGPTRLEIALDGDLTASRRLDRQSGRRIFPRPLSPLARRNRVHFHPWSAKTTGDHPTHVSSSSPFLRRRARNGRTSFSRAGMKVPGRRPRPASSRGRMRSMPSIAACKS